MACDVADLPDVDWENASTVDLMDPGFVYTAPVIDTRLAGEVDVTISSSVGAAIGPGPTLEIRGDP